MSADDGDDLMDEDSLLSAEDLKPKVKVAEDASDCATARTPRTLTPLQIPCVFARKDLARVCLSELGTS